METIKGAVTFAQIFTTNNTKNAESDHIRTRKDNHTSM